MWESVISQVSHSHSHMIESHKVISYDVCGKTVHRLCSSCISSIENLMEALSSPPC